MYEPDYLTSREEHPDIHFLLRQLQIAEKFLSDPTLPLFNKIFLPLKKGILPIRNSI